MRELAELGHHIGVGVAGHDEGGDDDVGEFEVFDAGEAFLVVLHALVAVAARRRRLREREHEVAPLVIGHDLVGAPLDLVAGEVALGLGRR